MNLLVEKLGQLDKFRSYIGNIKKNTSPIMLSGLSDVGKIHIISGTKEYAKKPICIVTYNEIQAKKLVKDLQYFMGNTVHFFPKKEIVTYDYIAESKELPYERIDVLNAMYDKNVLVIVTTIEAVMQKLLPQEELYKNVLKFKVGATYSLDQIKEKLVLLGYERYDLIEGKGQFSVRGGIVDVAISDKFGIRMEFWGDEIDSIRQFAITDQRSVKMLNTITIYPAHEYVLTQELEKVVKTISEKQAIEKTQEDIEFIQSGNYISKIDKYFDSFYEKQVSFLEYLSEDYAVFLDEVDKIEARAENITKDNKNIVKSLIEKEKIVPDAIANMYDFAQTIDIISHKQCIYLEKQDIGIAEVNRVQARNNGYDFSYREVNFTKASIELFFEDITKAMSKKNLVIVLGGSKENSKKLSELLFEKEITNRLVEGLEDITYQEGEVIVSTKALSAGFECYELNMLVITGEELFYNDAKGKRRKISSAFKEGEKVVFEDLKVGDYVVHKTHGIGQFIGVNTITADKITKDYIKIKYKAEDVLYVPTNQLDNIRKYIGGGEGTPRLNRLGSKEWESTKAKVKSNLREVARELIELYAKRQKVQGYSFGKDNPWQKQFEDSFPYTETDDQLRCIEEVKKDMELAKPMDRLLCGDVGYGKTEVALRAAFKACMDQKQVAYLAPTTILANQQYHDFKERMKEYPINVELLNRFRTKKEQEAIIKKLKLGEVDVVIGTHRILSKDVQFKDLGFLIIDEEHRFGVKDKERIKELKTNVDVLTMTATPIPRTLHMSIVGIRDMSVIYEPPHNRRPVQTYVLEQDEEVVQEAITKELERDGQVFYLYNKVETIIQKSEHISSLVPEAKVAFAHGKMSGRELEEIMQDFIDKKVNVLVCTTILESGIDIPNANTIIVENADKLGLAQLYQIRGRVGRGDKQAYAYIMYKRDKLLSEVADKRLKAIKEFTEFGSGFKIAMRDLEIRGAGSLLGEMQHGHMEQVGYDTYCKLLDEVVKEMQGIEVPEERDVQIDLDISSYIPDEYIENSSTKIEVYQNIALCRTEKDIQDVIDELIDRFGTMPKEVENLLEIARIKAQSKEAYITKIAQKQRNIVFHFDPKMFAMEIVDNLVAKYKNRIKFSPGIEAYITYTLESDMDSKIVKEIKEFLKECQLPKEEL